MCWGFFDLLACLHPHPLAPFFKNARVGHTPEPPPHPLPTPYLQPETYFVQNVVDLVGVRVGVRVRVSWLHEEPRLGAIGLAALQLARLLEVRVIGLGL